MAGAMDVTFHRAFDMCADLMLALEDVYQTGIRRVLTSGGRNTAPEGLEILANLTAAAGDRLSIMAGSGVRATNLRSEEHTSELQSLMRISYAVFCLKKKK